MKRDATLRNDRLAIALVAIFTALAYAIMAAIVILMLSGCTSTVRPVVVQARQPSWDGHQQNSGVIGIDTADNRILTPHARDRYNELMEAYGKAFRPEVHANDGITPTETNTFLIDPQHWECALK